MLQKWCLGILLMAALTLLSSLSLIMTNIHSSTAIIAQESQARRLPPEKEFVNAFKTGKPDVLGYDAPIERYPLLITPSWLVWSRFDDSSQQIFGALRLSVGWGVGIDDLFEKDTTPIDSLDVLNFADTTVRKMAVVQFVNLQGDVRLQTSKVFVGGFAQAINPTCFPFDQQTMKFIIRLQPPADSFYYLRLRCQGERATQPQSNASTKGLKKDCTVHFDGKKALGFYWDAFTCIVESKDAIVCSMTGVREFAPMLKTYLIPSAIFSAMGYISFMMDSSMIMPRVATTMLALLTLNTLKVQLTAELPAKEMSWLEEYVLVSIIFMFLNLIGHIVAFYFVCKEYRAAQQIVDNTSYSVVSSLFLVIVCASLVQRNCMHISTAASVALVSVPTVLLLVTMLFTLIRIRQFKVTAKLELRLDENDDVVQQGAMR